ncbi:MAG: hypothetical protein RSD22_06750 [Romboutsia sp.]
MIKLSELEKTYTSNIYELSLTSNTINTYILEANGDKHYCGDDFNFDKCFDNAISMSKDIEILKSKITHANNITKINIDNNEITIQNGINKLRVIREQYRRFEDMLKNSKVSKKRNYSLCSVELLVYNK